MAEVFKVWTTFNLKGDALTKMKEFTELTKASYKQIKLLNERLERSSVLFKLLNGDLTKFNQNLSGMNLNTEKLSLTIGKLNPETSKLATTFVRLNTNSKGSAKSFASLNGAMNMTNERTKSLIRNTAILSEELTAVNTKSELAGAGLRNIKGGRVGHVGGMGGGMMAGGMIGAAVGTAEFAAVVGVGATLKSAFTTGNQYQILQGQLKALGYNDRQLASVRNFTASSNIQGVSQLEMMHAYIDAQMATRESPAEAAMKGSEVQRLAPALSKAQFAANVMYGGMSDQEEMNLVRFAEIMGGSSMEKRMAALDAAAQIMVSSGGTIRPTELRTFARQAGGAFMNLDPEALVGLEPVLQEQGGAKMATALVTGLRQLVTGTGSNFNKKQVEYLEHLGILKATFDSEGRPLGVHMKSQYEKILGRDPYEFLTTVILPLMKKTGIDVNDPTQVSHALTLGFGRTMSNLLQIMWKNMQSIDRQRDQLHHIGGVESQYQLALGLGAASPKLVAAAWSDFALALGKVTNPLINSGLRALAASLEDLAKGLNFLTDGHKGVGRKIVDSFNRGGALGNIAVASTGPFGYLGMGVASIASAYQDKKRAISEAPISAQPGGYSTINMNVDSRKLAEIMLPAMTKMISGGGTISGTASTNLSLTPVSTNYNSIGNP